MTELPEDASPPPAVPGSAAGEAPDVCPLCGNPLAKARRFPALAPAVVLTGCLLTFHLVGFALIGLGAWLWTRRAGPVCSRCRNN